MKPRKREVKDSDEVLGILARCNTVRIGVFDGERPYDVVIAILAVVISVTALLREAAVLVRALGEPRNEEDR